MLKLLPLFAIFILQGCMTDSNTLEVTGAGAEQAEKISSAEFDRPNVTNVYVENNQLVIEGSAFHHVDKIRIKGTGNQAFDDEFTIQSKNKNRIMANSKRNITYLVGAMFSMVLSNAYGSATMRLALPFQMVASQVRRLIV